jgi:hypothetical protein
MFLSIEKAAQSLAVLNRDELLALLWTYNWVMFTNWFIWAVIKLFLAKNTSLNYGSYAITQVIVYFVSANTRHCP